MKVLALINEKGGVGKTALAVNIAAWLANAGRSVLLIDLDAQKGGASDYCGWQLAPDVFNFIAQGRHWLDCTVVGGASAPLLRLMRTDHLTALIPDAVGDNGIVEALDTVRGEFDVILIDTGPTPSKLNSMLYRAVDMILYPTELEFASFGSLEASFESLAKSNVARQAEGLPPVERMGIVPTRCNLQTVLHQVNLKALRAAYDDLVWQPVAARVAWGDAWQRRRAVWDYDDGAAAAECVAVCERVEAMVNV